MKLDARESLNDLLRRMPKDDAEHLAPHLEPVTLKHGQVLYEARGKIKYSYFPSQGCLSAVVVMANGDMIEVATVGNEGAVGLPAAPGLATSPQRVLVQIAGHGLRCEIGVLERRAGERPALRKLFAAYSAAFMFQVSQSVACNGLHAVQDRCCRWLLMTHDRVPSDDIPLTHEFLAVMLGVRRASVTDVLRVLQDKGFIRNARGVITVVDRAGMERCACECYRAARQEYVRLLG